MNDDQYLLANAYVDGELTPDERVLAEADPDVMSEVELLATLQSRLRKVDPPTASSREAALAAAMGAFPAVAPRPAPPINAAVKSPVPLRRRPAYARWLGVAAALVGIGLLGTVVVTGLRSGDDDSAASEPATEAEAEAGLFADEPADQPADEPGATNADRITESAEVDTADSGDMQLDTPAAPADAEAGPPASAEPDGDASAEQPADEAASEQADDSSEPGRPVIDPTQPIAGPIHLGAYGTYLLGLQTAGELPPTPNTDCPQPGVLGHARYLFDDVAVEVYIAIDDQERTVSAIDPNTCETLAVGPLF